MSTKSNKINWSNNQKRQQEVADSAQAIILGVYLIALTLNLALNGESGPMIVWSIVAFSLSTLIFAMFGAVQLAFAVAPRLAVAK